MTALDIVEKYISFFEKRGHRRIPNAPLVPENDPSTLFTSSGMQPLVPYLLGEPHPQGKRLVNVQNCFRAQDIDEVGDNRHTTFFRMLGNWSLGDYFKKEQIPWMWEFLISKTEGLGLDPKKLYVTVFEGFENIKKDEESSQIWKNLLEKEGLNPNERIFYYGVSKNWWSRAGEPKNMPIGEPGGPDTEVFFDFGTLHTTEYGGYCHPNCQCGRFMEIGNSVFMQYKKTKDGFFQLPQKNVDFGAGLERLLAAVEKKQDIFQTSLLLPIIRIVEQTTDKQYKNHALYMRIITDHFIAATFMIANGISPSNKEQGYILRRLIRRGLDNFYFLCVSRHSATLPRMTIPNDIAPILGSIVKQYRQTDPDLADHYEKIKNTILEEKDVYKSTLTKAKNYIIKKYKAKLIGNDLMGTVKISANDAFSIYATHGLSPTQIKSLGYSFNDQEFAEKMKSHQNISRKGAERKFAGGLADHQGKTIMGHTATHLLHQALRDVLGNHVYQTGSNITSERIRFDFNYDKSLTDKQLNKVKEIVNQKIRANLPVHFEMLSLKKAKEIGAIGLFDDKYANTVKIYFIGNKKPYSVEFCGGPHVKGTNKIKKFSIIKQESIGSGKRRIYAKVD